MYNFHKKRHRNFYGKPTRKVRRWVKRKGKSKGKGKRMGKSSVGQYLVSLSDAEVGHVFKGVGKGRIKGRTSGKGKGRVGNPVGPDGNKYRCYRCESELHMVKDCPHPEGYEALTMMENNTRAIADHAPQASQQAGTWLIASDEVEHDHHHDHLPHEVFLTRGPLSGTGALEGEVHQAAPNDYDYDTNYDHDTTSAHTICSAYPVITNAGDVPEQQETPPAQSAIDTPVPEVQPAEPTPPANIFAQHDDAAVETPRCRCNVSVSTGLGMGKPWTNRCVAKPKVDSCTNYSLFQHAAAGWNAPTAKSVPTPPPPPKRGGSHQSRSLLPHEEFPTCFR